jgi:hypothetical protein
MEKIVRPFVGEDVAPTSFIKPGSIGAPPVRIGPIGYPGGTTTFPFSSNFTATFYLMAVHKEKAVPAFDFSK